MNGQLQTETYAGTTGMINSQPDLLIGQFGNSQYFNGTLDEIKVFNVTLSAAQIQRIFQVENKSINVNEMVFNETATGEQWVCSVTPNDGNEDGATNGTPNPSRPSCYWLR